MNPVLKNQFRRLDRALLALLDERVRLARELAPGDASVAPALEDLLRRHAGPSSPEDLRELFAAVARACERAQRAQEHP